MHVKLRVQLRWRCTRPWFRQTPGLGRVGAQAYDPSMPKVKAGGSKGSGNSRSFMLLTTNQDMTPCLKKKYCKQVHYMVIVLWLHMALTKGDAGPRLDGNSHNFPNS